VLKIFLECGATDSQNVFNFYECGLKERPFLLHQYKMIPI